MKRHFLYEGGQLSESNGTGSEGTPIENQLIGQLSDGEIAALKEQFKDGIYGLEVDGHIGYFKNPNRKEMNAAMSKASADEALAMYETLARITFKGGSAAILKDNEMFFGITQELKKKMDGKKAILVNL